MLPTTASFLVTEDCNLRCKYCFEKHHPNLMTKEVAKKSLEFLSENALLSSSQNFHAMLFGGEPLLNIDLIEYIFEVGEELAKEKHLSFSTSIITNATIMSDRIYSVLEKHKDSSHLTVQLSIDGDEETQDMYRVTKEGKGSFHLAERNIQKFQQLFRRDSHKLCIHGCINKQSLPNLYNNYRLFREQWGFTNIWFLPVAEEKWTQEDVDIYDKENEKIYNEIAFELKGTRNLGVLRRYAPMDRCLDYCIAEKPCGAGDNFVSITASGDIYPCHQIYFNDEEHEYLIGNVFDGLIEDKRKIFTEYDNSYLNCDEGCKNGHCYRCIASNLSNNGNLFNQTKGLYCALMSIDNKYQTKLNNLAKELGLIALRNEEDNQACLCNSREGRPVNGCDIVKSDGVCESGDNPENPNCLCDSRQSNNLDVNNTVDTEDESNMDKMNEKEMKDFIETTTMALQILINKIENVEKRLDKIDESNEKAQE